MDEINTKSRFSFNFFYVFKVLNMEVSNEDIHKMFNANDSIITTYKNDEIVLKNNYQDIIRKAEKDFEEKSKELNQFIEKETGEKTEKMIFKMRPLSYGLDKKLLTQMDTISISEKHLLGKEYKRYGLKPFVVSIDQSFMRGTSILTYLGSNIFSIQVSILEDFELSYDEAVYLSRTNFGDFTFRLADNNILVGQGISELLHVYKIMLSESFGKKFVIYGTRVYEGLVGIDYWTDSNREIFYFLHQPVSRDRLSELKESYIDEVISKSNLSRFNDLNVNACTHRALLSLGKLYEFVKNQPGFDMSDIDKFIYDQQAQIFLPLQRALGSYCMIENLIDSIRKRTQISIKELELFKTTLKLALNNYLLDEDYTYSTVNDMTEKFREIIGFHQLCDKVKLNIDLIKSIIDGKNKEYSEASRNALTILLGTLSIFSGVNVIDVWIKLLQKIGFQYSINHPLKLTLLLWSVLFVIAFIICFNVIYKKNIKIDFSNLLFKDSEMVIKRLNVKTYFLFRKRKKKGT